MAKLSLRISLASLCGFALAAGTADAAVTSVYKCFDRNLNVVYTDQPCRGEHLSIETGIVDHAAVAELQREREAVTRSAAQRVAELRTLPAPVGNYGYGGPAFVENGYGGNADVYYPAFGYGSYGNGDRSRKRPDYARNNFGKQQRFVPAPKGDLMKR